MGPVSDPLAVRFGPAALSALFSSASQTFSPDGKVLSVLFNGVSVEVEAAGTRAAAMAGSLMVPLEGVTTPVFIKMRRGGGRRRGRDQSARDPSQRLLSGEQLLNSWWPDSARCDSGTQVGRTFRCHQLRVERPSVWC